MKRWKERTVTPIKTKKVSIDHTSNPHPGSFFWGRSVEKSRSDTVLPDELGSKGGLMFEPSINYPTSMSGGASQI